jgi:hypothetical protein
MLLISHRGNINGSNTNTENSIPQIAIAMRHGFDVEVDVRLLGNDWYLGHDYAQYKIEQSFLQEHAEKLWCHAKNVEALEKMLELKLNCFWHQDDQYTLTSRGIVWAYPNYYCKGAVLVMPAKEFLDNLKESIYGICIDNPQNYL